MNYERFPTETVFNYVIKNIYFIDFKLWSILVLKIHKCKKLLYIYYNQ